jgi:hypothetical protein
MVSVGATIPPLFVRKMVIAGYGYPGGRRRIVGGMDMRHGAATIPRRPEGLDEEEWQGILDAEPGCRITGNFTLVCPDGHCVKCGGTGFDAKRTILWILTAGYFFAPKTRVECVTCGTEYRRG